MVGRFVGFLIYSGLEGRESSALHGHPESRGLQDELREQGRGLKKKKKQEESPGVVMSEKF